MTEKMEEEQQVGEESRSLTQIKERLRIRSGIRTNQKYKGVNKHKPV